MQKYIFWVDVNVTKTPTRDSLKVVSIRRDWEDRGGSLKKPPWRDESIFKMFLIINTTFVDNEIKCKRDNKLVSFDRAETTIVKVSQTPLSNPNALPFVLTGPGSTLLSSAAISFEFRYEAEPRAFFRRLVTNFRNHVTFHLFIKTILAEYSKNWFGRMISLTFWCVHVAERILKFYRDQILLRIMSFRSRKIYCGPFGNSWVSRTQPDDPTNFSPLQIS